MYVAGSVNRLDSGHGHRELPMPRRCYYKLSEQDLTRPLMEYRIRQHRGVICPPFVCATAVRSSVKIADELVSSIESLPIERQVRLRGIHSLIGPVAGDNENDRKNHKKEMTK
jgi:hypothetical protein